METSSSTMYWIHFLDDNKKNIIYAKKQLVFKTEN